MSIVALSNIEHDGTLYVAGQAITAITAEQEKALVLSGSARYSDNTPQAAPSTEVAPAAPTAPEAPTTPTTKVEVK